jgi:hypothetical protein
MSEVPLSMMRDPGTLMENGCSYRELFRLIERLSVTSHGDESSLPDEIIREIANFVPLKPVVPAEVIAIRASTSRAGLKFHSSTALHTCITKTEGGRPTGSCWLRSLVGKLETGGRNEVVEFQLSCHGPCLLTSMSIALTIGGFERCNIRTMRLDCLFGNTWMPISPVWAVENVRGWQRSQLECPVEAQRVRLVLLSSQFGVDRPFMENHAMMRCFCVKFE